MLPSYSFLTRYTSDDRDYGDLVMVLRPAILHDDEDFDDLDDDDLQDYLQTRYHP